MATYGYLRVSTADQDAEKFKFRILDYANAQGLGNVTFVEEHVSGSKEWRNRKLGELLLDRCQEGDKIVVPELSRLARSIRQIYEILEAAHEKHVGLHILKQVIVVNGKLDMTTKVMLNTFAMVAELERDFVSERTTEALAERKRLGVKLGRPKGSGRSKLDPHKEEIAQLLELGVTQAKLAERYGVTRATLSRFVHKHNLIVT